MFENAKQLACYCGVVPFSKSSGTSARSRPHVSRFANRKLKSLLHLCAMAALRFNKELKEYYERKVAEGKNKRSVINAIRNKLLQRIFAVVRDHRKYVENYHLNCAKSMLYEVRDSDEAHQAGEAADRCGAIRFAPCATSVGGLL